MEDEIVIGWYARHVLPKPLIAFDWISMDKIISYQQSSLDYQVCDKVDKLRVLETSKRHASVTLYTPNQRVGQPFAFLRG